MPTREGGGEAPPLGEDPELGMDIVELGLFYDVEIDGSKVKVIHSLTSMGCPAGPMIQEDIRAVVANLDGVEDVEIDLTWDPPWTPERMSEEPKFIFGFGKGFAPHVSLFFVLGAGLMLVDRAEAAVALRTSSRSTFTVRPVPTASSAKMKRGSNPASWLEASATLVAIVSRGV